MTLVSKPVGLTVKLRDRSFEHLVSDRGQDSLVVAAVSVVVALK
jgi:hypothetical protein